jgi:hypothetical protein
MKAEHGITMVEVKEPIGIPAITEGSLPSDVLKKIEGWGDFQGLDCPETTFLAIYHLL